MQNNTKLLVSPKTIEEAKIVINANVDFIDCKNPEEGSLGANFPWIIKEMKDYQIWRIFETFPDKKFYFHCRVIPGNGKIHDFIRLRR